MELTQTPRSAISHINRGVITLLEAAIYFVLVLVVLAIAITQGAVCLTVMMRARNTTTQPSC